MSDGTLRVLVDLRDRQIQKARIQFGNRLSALDNGTDEAGPEQREMVERWASTFETMEKQLDRDIQIMVKREPFFEELNSIKGIGPMYAAKLIALIDIERPPTASALWRYAGYAVIDGARERRRKGETSHYNVRLKAACFLITASFLKCGSPYCRVYHQAKDHYKQTHPDWTPKHLDYAARGNMIKRFLAHLWERWRILEGLPLRPPYVKEYLGHTSIDRPQDYGWHSE